MPKLASVSSSWRTRSSSSSGRVLGRAAAAASKRRWTASCRSRPSRGGRRRLRPPEASRPAVSPFAAGGRSSFGSAGSHPGRPRPPVPQRRPRARRTRPACAGVVKAFACASRALSPAAAVLDVRRAQASRTGWSTSSMPATATAAAPASPVPSGPSRRMKAPANRPPTMPPAAVAGRRRLLPRAPRRRPVGGETIIQMKTDGGHQKHQGEAQKPPEHRRVPQATGRGGRPARPRSAPGRRPPSRPPGAGSPPSARRFRPLRRKTG